jgi:hypothetical protein
VRHRNPLFFLIHRGVLDNTFDRAAITVSKGLLEKIGQEALQLLNPTHLRRQKRPSPGRSETGRSETASIFISLFERISPQNGEREVKFRSRANEVSG